MKNKKIIYVLLPAALLIWGFIIIKIIARVKQPGKEYQIHQSAIKPESGILKGDTINLIADYRDPFLGSINVQHRPARKIVEPTKRAFKSKKESDVNIQWPEIIYKGTITNNRNEQHTALIRIDNADFLIHRGDMIKGIIFNKIYTDSIKTEYQHESKTIIRKY